MATTLVPFSSVLLKDEDAATLQDNVGLSLNPILTKEILDGRLISDIPLVNGITNHISHGLSRAVNGYIVVKKNANSNIWDLESANNMKESFLDLTCSAVCTVTLWVF